MNRILFLESCLITACTNFNFKGYVSFSIKLYFITVSII